MRNLFRTSNTTVSGLGFPPATIAAVWNKAQAVFGYDSSEWRKDGCGAWIRCSEYGNTSSQHGWEIDHIQPVAKNGTDYITNLQPLQWENNRHKSDSYPEWSCKISARVA